MIKITENMYLENLTLYHRSFKSALHKTLKGTAPGLFGFSMFKNGKGSQAIKDSSHKFNLKQERKYNENQKRTL